MAEDSYEYVLSYKGPDYMVKNMNFSLGIFHSSRKCIGSGLSIAINCTSGLKFEMIPRIECKEMHGFLHL